MRKLSRSKVFLCGLDAVGVEIGRLFSLVFYCSIPKAKNLVLGGIEELTIQDNAICTVADMGVQFFIRQADVDSGKTRAEASLPHLVALNPYVRVSLETNDVTSVTAPLASEANLQLLKPLWNPDEEKTTKVEFIYTNVYGVLGNLFCDFGPQFNVLDPDGEPPKEFFIGHVGKLNSTQLLVKVFGDRRHYLETGNVIQFRSLEGMTELNGKVFPVQVISPSELVIYTVTEELSGYTGGGIACQVIQPQMQSFETLLEQLRKPKITTADLSRPPEEGTLLHLVFLSLMKFQHEEGRLPEPWSDSDWNLFSDKFHALNELSPLKIDQPNVEFVRRLATVSQGQLAPLCAFFGGVAAQETMKALTGSFTPLNQWLYLHCESVIPSTSVTARTNTELHSRYGPLAICIGPENLQRLKNLSAFMVGCGAIGCELLKNLALIGVATGGRAAISQTQPMRDSDSQQTSVGQKVDTCGSSGQLHSPLPVCQPDKGGAGDVTRGQFTPSCNPSTAQTLRSTSLNHDIPDGSTVLDDPQAGVSVTGITVENDLVRTGRSGVLVDEASETRAPNTEPISQHSAISSTSHRPDSRTHTSAEVCVKRPKADSREAMRSVCQIRSKDDPLTVLVVSFDRPTSPIEDSRTDAYSGSQIQLLMRRRPWRNPPNLSRYV
ncbi:ubiquitin-like modifier-activating enzyme 6 [Clonorchis sinensis]|uniref:Ubiquitin-like modifier-activating enzyme 6 n=1 Tax=Clonorchis sinensis TaxID=79923 RepID=G7YX09_CLOSI|nr:ubiquitin-like modifier-activating enzyme 6 [Clonorchis sinensis]